MHCLSTVVELTMCILSPCSERRLAIMATKLKEARCVYVCVWCVFVCICILVCMHVCVRVHACVCTMALLTTIIGAYDNSFSSASVRLSQIVLHDDVAIIMLGSYGRVIKCCHRNPCPVAVSELALWFISNCL